MIEEHKKYWFILCTKARQELKVSEILNQLGIEAYTPTKIEVKSWSDRIKKVRTSLLPSMVLVKIPKNKVNKVFDVPEVKRYLFVNGVRAKVYDYEVDAMKSYLFSKFKSDGQIKIGNEINIPHLNQSGKIIKVNARKCIVRLQLLGAKMSIQLS
ncbi:MAG: transcriptional elongation/antitermination factor NusG-like protein [Flavobacteriales bacterium TMED288]|nr:transcriptional elongation/antitermination factor NusG-like protein [Flavobacteriales bacterium]RPG52981.1 MAG: transcriptional elongation/antitermination factor NusG-like protein [Flavobacteriales bacterium TMED288]|tara:strand:+ start:924 stop:1388 length:465 start_codon:yes stop_codon:yes gene_type:complete